MYGLVLHKYELDTTNLVFLSSFSNQYKDISNAKTMIPEAKYLNLHFFLKVALLPQAWSGPMESQDKESKLLLRT